MEATIKVTSQEHPKESFDGVFIETMTKYTNVMYSDLGIELDLESRSLFTTHIIALEAAIASLSPIAHELNLHVTSRFGTFSPAARLIMFRLLSFCISITMNLVSMKVMTRDRKVTKTEIIDFLNRYIECISDKKLLSVYITKLTQLNPTLTVQLKLKQ